MSVNEKKWLVMHMHVQLKLDKLELRHSITTHGHLARAAVYTTKLRGLDPTKVKVHSSSWARPQ